MVDKLRREAEGGSAIFINCGNLTRRTARNNFGIKHQVLKTALKSYDLMGADIFAPGAQELIYGRKLMLSLNDYTDKSTIVCGNLGGKPLPGFKTHKIINIDDKKILITSIIDKRLEGKAIHGLNVNDPLTSLKKILEIPHDVAIVILHFSDNRARKLLRNADGVDIAVLATQRGILRDRKIINGCRLVKNNNHGKTIGYLDWDFAKNAPTANKILAINKKTYPADKEVSRLVDEHETWLRKHYIEIEKRNAAVGTAADSPYVGETRCGTCHPQIAASWKKTRHAKAYATLQKKCKDYCPDCLPCHSTGSLSHYKKGFRSPATTPHLLNVQCEECHGAARKHLENPARPYGRAVSADVCVTCHNANTDPDFSYPEDRKLISHQR